jgi:hypothetical protein
MSDDARQPHDEKAEEVERQLDEMEERQERLGGDIETADSEWESRKHDEKVPGATSELDSESGEGSDDDAPELDFGKDEDTSAVAEAVPSEDSDSDDEDDDDEDDDESKDDSDEDDDSDDEDDADDEDDSEYDDSQDGSDEDDEDDDSEDDDFDDEDDSDESDGDDDAKE